MTTRSWIRSLFTRPVTRTIRKAPRRARLCLETLEDRVVPTTFTVLNGLDGGDGSLRAAIAAANDETNNPGHDTINFDPVNLSSAVDVLDAAYLPIVVQELAGLPLDPSFAEQRRILERCRGLFYDCAGGAEARRFNRLLIDAGLIKGL